MDHQAIAFVFTELKNLPGNKYSRFASLLFHIDQCNRLIEPGYFFS